MPMTCSQCWATVPAGRDVCPRCGAKATGAPPSLAGLAKNYPWVVVVLVLSASFTLWILTRRPPPPEPIPAAVEPEPVAQPVAETVQEPPAFPPVPAPVPAPAPAPDEQAVAAPDESFTQTEDGAWQGGAPLARPPGR